MDPNMDLLVTKFRCLCETNKLKGWFSDVGNDQFQPLQEISAKITRNVFEIKFIMKAKLCWRRRPLEIFIRWWTLNLSVAGKRSSAVVAIEVWLMRIWWSCVICKWKFHDFKQQKLQWYIVNFTLVICIIPKPWHFLTTSQLFSPFLKVIEPKLDLNRQGSDRIHQKSPQMVRTSLSTCLSKRAAHFSFRFLWNCVSSASNTNKRYNGQTCVQVCVCIGAITIHVCDDLSQWTWLRAFIVDRH